MAGFASSFIAARNDAAKRTAEAEDRAHMRARQPIVEAQQDQFAAQKLAAGEQDLTKGAADIAASAEARKLTAQQTLMARRAQFTGAIANQLDQNPNAKPSEIAAKAPPEVLQAVGLDDPQQMAHFAEVYDNNPQQLRVASQMYGAPGRKLVKAERGEDKDGKPGSLITFADGTQEFHADYAPSKEFAPKAPVDPEMQDLKKELIRTQISNTGARTAATEAATTSKAGSPEQTSGVVADLNDFIGKIKALDTGGGAVKPGQNIVQNALNAGLSTGAGKVAGAIMGEKNTPTRQAIDTLAPAILQSYAKALGMTGQQLNTEKEYGRYARVLGDPTADPGVRVEAAERLRDKLIARGAVGAGGAPAAKKVLKYDPATGELK